MDVNDAELWYMYCHANAVLVPSLVEGFSLPLVEALAADVPLLCSDIPVHREVASDYSTIINPLHRKDWADLLSSTPTVMRPSEKLGPRLYRQRCDYFSKERMVSEHIRLYSELLH